MLKTASSIQQARNSFKWQIPEYYNIANDVCGRWAEDEPDRVAIIHDDGDRITQITYAELQARSSKLANYLAKQGIGRGDRIAILLPQDPWTAIAHIAAYKMGAIAVPLFTQFGSEALKFRLSDSAARVLITHKSGAQKVSALRSDLPELEHLLTIDGGDTKPGIGTIESYPGRFDTVDTLADDPALIIYTSGTTGNPKGALHAHRTLLGHLPGVEMSHDFFPQPGDRIWTPADWAWIGGLLDVLMPALHHGVPVISRRFEKFSGEAAFELINRHGVRNAFLPPTALKMMRAVSSENCRIERPMRSIASGGETLGAELLKWGRDVFGLTINEFYGQTECNMVVSSCGVMSDPTPGVMGFAVPGHDVQVISEQGAILDPGQSGHIAIRAPDPVMFLEYWNAPDKTAEKFIGEWLVTGDTGMREDDGRIRFIGRDDDVITSSGYRIGPGEIENCLISHDAVEMAGVVGKPDPLRGEIVKAFIVLKSGHPPGDKLRDDIQRWVKEQLAAYEYPREIEFVEELPLTATGKIIRRALREE